MQERLKWIDNSRGIAIILVVIGHVVSSYHEAGLYESSVFFNFTSYFIYSFHMALFMLLSGYLCTLKSSNRPKKKQILHKLVSYGIPYVVFSFLWVIMKILMSSVTNSGISMKNLIGIPVYPISFMWFIYALLIMQVIQILIGEQSKIFKVGHLIVAGVGYCIRPLLGDIFSSIRFSDCILNDFFKFYVFFVIGAYCLDYILKKINSTKSIIFIITGGLLLIGNIITFNNIQIRSLPYNFIIALIGSLFLIILGILLKETKYLPYFGKQTLPIYVLQGFAIAASRLALTRIGLNDSFGIIPILICTIAGVILPLIAYWITMRIGRLEGIFYPGKYIRF